MEKNDPPSLKQRNAICVMPKSQNLGFDTVRTKHYHSYKKRGQKILVFINRFPKIKSVGGGRISMSRSVIYINEGPQAPRETRRIRPNKESLQRLVTWIMVT